MGYRVVVRECPQDKIRFIKILRTIGMLGLAEAKEAEEYISANTPCVIINGVSAEKAHDAVARITALGGSVAAEESSCDTPMMLRPSVADLYDWSFWSGPKKRV